MIKKLQTTTKYYAKTEDEAEGRIVKKINPTQDLKRLNLL